MVTRAEYQDLYEGDWAHIDGIESVSVTPKNRSGSVMSGIRALRGDLDKREAAAIGPGLLELDYQVFTLWAATITGGEVRRGDELTDSDDDEWLIHSISEQAVGTQLRCVVSRKVA